MSFQFSSLDRSAVLVNPSATQLCKEHSPESGAVEEGEGQDEEEEQGMRIMRWMRKSKRMRMRTRMARRRGMMRMRGETEDVLERTSRRIAYVAAKLCSAPLQGREEKPSSV